MRIFTCLATLMALAACGADGEPTRPMASATLSVGDSGLHIGTRIGVTRGPVTATLAL